MSTHHITGHLVLTLLPLIVPISVASQVECILAWLESRNILQSLHNRGGGAVYPALGPVQNEKMALLPVRLLLRGKRVDAPAHLGVPPLSIHAQGMQLQTPAGGLPLPVKCVLQV